ncbi:MAG: hypothetical protein DCC75_01455 [Proteobacteria bacterium]|nr:MAG: hypothetical protein DCC75_01455 [Pseudomonadota bacterium]
MHTILESSPEFKALDLGFKEAAERLLQRLEMPLVEVVLEADREVTRRAIEENSIYRLKEGCLRCLFRGKPLCFFDEGDVIGLGMSVTSPYFELISDFAVLAEKIPLDEAHKKILSSEELFGVYQEVLALHQHRQAALLAMFAEPEVVLAPNLKSIAAGQTIIEQGGQAEAVYSLIEGKAEAYVDGVLVGEIQQDDIFGMLAVITKGLRTATVIAKSDCVVLSVPPEKFIELINTRPAAVLSMIEDMARTITELNAKVVGAAKGNTRTIF